MRAVGILLVAAALLPVAPVLAQADSGRVAVRVCDGDDDWPPFSERVGSSERVAGFVPALLEEVLEGTRYRAEIEKELSWPRCQEAVRAGEERQMALQAAWSEARAREFLLSAPIYTLEAAYFFSTDVFPAGLEIDAIEDLNRHRICGVRGFDYSYEGLDHEAVDQTAEDYEALVRNLHRGRCEVFVESATVLRALSRRSGGWLDDPRLRWHPVPDLEGDTYHFLVSRQWEGGEDLVGALDAGIERLRESGRLAELEAEVLGDESSAAAPAELR